MTKFLHPFMTKENLTRSLSKSTAWLVYGIIVTVYAMSLFALMAYRQDDGMWSFFDVLPILKYSGLQAGLSAGLSCILGILLARAFFYLDFFGKAYLYKILSFVWALPSLVVIFALIGFWGNSGWMAKFLQGTLSTTANNHDFFAF